VGDTLNDLADPITPLGSHIAFMDVPENAKVRHAMMKPAVVTLGELPDGKAEGIFKGIDTAIISCMDPNSFT